MLPTQLIEWATWQDLDKYQSFELILLKGHLQIEMFLGVCLRSRAKLIESKIFNLSFHGKLLKLGAIDCTDGKLSMLLEFARELNRMRNRLAHEAFAERIDIDLLNWAHDVLDKIPAQRFQKRTNRTIITHAMSSLAGSLYGYAHSEA